MQSRIVITKGEGYRKITFTTSKNVVEYEFHEITLKELLRRRMSGNPGVVYKDEEKVYYSDLQPGTESYFAGTGWKHICSQSGKECKHLSAASEENGGCAKVRDIFISTYAVKSPRSLKNAKMLEKYDFVKEGIEIFNSQHYSLNVSSCANYVKMAPRAANTLELTEPQKMWAEDDKKRKLEEHNKRYSN